MNTADLTTWSAEQFLEVPPSRPERVFSLDEVTARSEWQSLRSAWHPDRNKHPRASEVFGHLQILFDAAAKRRLSGLWDDGRILSVSAVDGRCFRLRYVVRHDIDVGQMYIGRRVVAFVLSAEHQGLARDALEMLRALPFSDSRMREIMRTALPHPRCQISAAGGNLLVLDKGADFVALRDLLTAEKGTLPAKHIAWIVSSLLNITCYLAVAGLGHQAIDLDHCLVSPEGHAVNLAGGWWFAGMQDTPWRVLPARSVRAAPPDVMARQCIDVRLDQFLVRAVGCELAGHRFAHLPVSMREYLTLPPVGDPVADYAAWQQALWNSFGERRFTPMAASFDTVYPMAS